MTNTEKLEMLKILLGDDASAFADDTLTAYLDIARREILSWKYSAIGAVPEDVTDVATADEVVQLHSVVVALNLQGVEGQSSSIENGIHRDFSYETMVEYIRSHVSVYARVF